MYIRAYNSSDRIRYQFLKILIFMIWFISYGYCKSIFVLFRKFTNIQIFLFVTITTMLDKHME